MNEEAKKEVLRMFSYGVYLLTSKYSNNYSAATVTWVSQTSFDPPLISVCLKNNSNPYNVVKQRGNFVLHILNNKQKKMASSFFKPALVKGKYINDYKFNLKDDLPILEDSHSYLCCKVIKILEFGDHPLFLSEVIDAAAKQKEIPLGLRETGWSYGG